MYVEVFMGNKIKRLKTPSLPWNTPLPHGGSSTSYASRHTVVPESGEVYHTPPSLSVSELETLNTTGSGETSRYLCMWLGTCFVSVVVADVVNGA